MQETVYMQTDDPTLHDAMDIDQGAIEFIIQNTKETNQNIFMDMDPMSMHYDAEL